MRVLTSLKLNINTEETTAKPEKIFVEQQINHYSEFKYIFAPIDNLRQILKDISFILSILMWLWLRFIMYKIYHPLLNIHDKLAKFSS